MVEKRGENRLLLKEIFLKRTNYLLSKQILKEKEVYNIVRDFFKEYYNVDYEFTQNELMDELKKIYFEPETRKKVEQLLEKAFKIQYSDKPLEIEELKSILKQFSKLLDTIIKKPARKGLVGIILRKMLGKRYKLIQPELNERIPIPVKPDIQIEPVPDVEEDKPNKPAGKKKNPIQEKQAKEQEVPPEYTPPKKKEDMDWLKQLREETDEPEPQKETSTIDWADDPTADNTTTKEPEEMQPPDQEEQETQAVVEKTNSKKKDFKNNKKKIKKIKKVVKKKKKTKKVTKEKKTERDPKPEQTQDSDEQPEVSIIPDIQLKQKTEVEPEQKQVQEIPESQPVPDVLPDQEPAHTGPRLRMDELLNTAENNIENNLDESKKIYKQLNFIYNNLPSEIKQEYFKKIHELYHKIHAAHSIQVS
ncbi:MAG: hypothetical protein KKG59_06990 [Nanoarchaeota archaeon]|nr:hypothetical protein [Nanoarchaeota archaeon]